MIVERSKQTILQTCQLLHRSDAVRQQATLQYYHRLFSCSFAYLTQLLTGRSSSSSVGMHLLFSRQTGAQLKLISYALHTL